jgi:hypothetical protein
MRLPNSIFGGILLCWLLKANVVAAITAPNITAQKSIEMTHALNHWMIYVFPYGVVAALVIAAIDVYRLVRINPRGSSTA